MSKQGKGVIKMTFQDGADARLLQRGQKAKVDEILTQMAGTIERVVDIATRVWTEAGNALNNTDGSLLPPLMLFHHAIESLDSVSVLFRRGCIDTAGTLIRSELEAMVSAYYILEKDSEQRGKCYRVWLLRTELRTLRRLDVSTPAGAEAAKSLKLDQFGGDKMRSPDLNLVRQEISEIEKILALSKYSAINAEYDRTKKSATMSRHGLNCSVVLARFAT